MCFLYYKQFLATHCGRGKVVWGWRGALTGRAKLNKLDSLPLGSDHRWALGSYFVGRPTYFRMGLCPSPATPE